MQQDEVKLVIHSYGNDHAVKDFESYSIDSDLLFAACAFSMDLSETNAVAAVGCPCKLFVNGKLEMNGLVETIETDDSKQSSSLKISGRDLMGMLVDSCCELSDCNALEDMSVVIAARQIARKMPVSRKQIMLQPGCKATASDGLLQVEAGMKIFDILSRYASMRGLIFYSAANGDMYFGKPKSRPLPGSLLGGQAGPLPKVNEPTFSLVRRRDGKGNNIEHAKVKRDISKSYSHVSVVSQFAGQGGAQEADASFENDDFPSNLYKPLVITQNGDVDSPAALAKMTVDKLRRDQLSLEYTVAGHSQNGNNWAINTFASVNDEIRGIQGDYLIYGRTFTRSKTEGTRTTLRLGKGGLP